MSCGAALERLPAAGPGAIASAIHVVGNVITAFFRGLAAVFRGMAMELNCPACGERRRMRRISRAKHSHLAAWFAGFLSFVFFWAGFFTFFVGWFASAFFFLLFVYWSMGTEKFWRCVECGHLLPRG